MVQAELVELKKQIKDLLEKQMVRSNVSPWGALLLLVEKDGGARLCVDYRQLNGHVILAEGIAVDPTKVEVVIQWERPRIATEIRSFVELASYYRRFIEGFSRIVMPLT
uniref:Transposon Ty3-I Gag-Pol polyprotein n=1 Tax=Cajanus cajan TaxID=3821 RepID=A0A151TI50_CAJCA|nr:hypothetical protein KK1_013019 [Cajanus cajan]